MKKIIYFGTHGCAGHYTVGINCHLNPCFRDIIEQSVDSAQFGTIIRENRMPGKCSSWFRDAIYSYYCLPYSIDDKRHGSKTVLIWEGEHTSDEMELLVSSNTFLYKQFDVENRSSSIGNNNIP